MIHPDVPPHYRRTEFDQAAYSYFQSLSRYPIVQIDPQIAGELIRLGLTTMLPKPHDTVDLPDAALRVDLK